MMNPLIIKLGGVLLDSEEALERLFSALVNYRESHQRPLVIVHGGGCVVDELMKGLNLPVKKKNGLRVTPADQIDIITGALAGTANKTLLAWAKKHQIAAVGLFLGDGDSVKVTQLDEELGHVGLAQPGSPKLNQIAAVGLFLGDGDSVKVTQLDEELGHVGLAQPGSPKLINSLLENGYLPVVSSIGVTDEGQLMNVNADQAATALAATLGADLILLSDVSGILDGKGQRIAEMTAAKAEQLIEQGIITDGMIVKVNAALDAARTLGRPVDIASWRHAEQLPALFNGMPMGTRILA
ncbi:acetylglutamate kinase [Escherichia coli]